MWLAYWLISLAESDCLTDTLKPPESTEMASNKWALCGLTGSHTEDALTLCFLPGRRKCSGGAEQTCPDMPGMLSWAAAEKGGAAEGGPQRGREGARLVCWYKSVTTQWVPSVNLRCHCCHLNFPFFPLQDAECLDCLCVIHPMRTRTRLCPELSAPLFGSNTSLQVKQTAKWFTSHCRLGAYNDCIVRKQPATPFENLPHYLRYGKPLNSNRPLLVVFSISSYTFKSNIKIFWKSFWKVIFLPSVTPSYNF